MVLRDFVEEDLEPYVAWNEPGQAWHAFDAPYLPHPRVEPAMVERIRDRIVNHRWDTPRSRMVVADAATGQLIGTVARYWESEETHWLALGIVLYDPTRWGRGLGTEALGLWTDHLFAEMPHLVRLGLRTWSGNHAMIRVATRLGFREEARFRRARIVDGQYYDALGFGVLREEWDPSLRRRA